MSSNKSLLSVSRSSGDTDDLIKIPHNFFAPEINVNSTIQSNMNINNSVFSSDDHFMRELDNFLTVEKPHSPVSYDQFSNTLQTKFEKNDIAPSNSGFKTRSLFNVQSEDLNLQEERLKRQHCEQLIGILQQKILQYQQKLTVLSKLDRDKDDVICRLKGNVGLDEENKELKEKLTIMEQEISDTIHLLKKFQSKNEILELKIENLTSTTTEMRDISKNQIQDLKIRLSNSTKTEQDLIKEIECLKASLKMSQENVTKELISKANLERDNISLKSQIKTTKEDRKQCLERHDLEKTTLEMKQKKIFNSLMNEFNDKERKLLKELDLQRNALKNYYQTQLESALEEKVMDIQEQLDHYQDKLKIESEKREKHLSERAIKQMELIISKYVFKSTLKLVLQLIINLISYFRNEEEIELTVKKCAEEKDLYKCQLFNASKTIEALESKLNDYQIRRSDIAQTLHGVMETQWKKTLEILTCPSKMRNIEIESIDQSECDNNRVSSMKQYPMNNLSKSEENIKTELLRNYIEMLLKQSPATNEEVNSHTTNEKPSMSSKTQHHPKSHPWK
ncbi:unnamed protein product [Diamesa serratosioi]